MESTAEWSRMAALVVACQRGVELHGIHCRVEHDGGSCHGLSERGGATWNSLQRVDQGSGPHHGLPGSSNLSAEARLGCLMEWNGSLSHRFRRSSDVFEVVTGLLLLGALSTDRTFPAAISDSPEY